MKTERKAYSLIEVIITLSLSLSILIGFIQVIAQAANLKNKTDSLNQMTFLLLNRLEEIRGLSPEKAGFLKENEEEITDLTSGEKYLCHWKFIPEASQAYRIEIEVFPLANPGRKVRATLWVISILGF
jgi:hypothetical protein